MHMKSYLHTFLITILSAVLLFSCDCSCDEELTPVGEVEFFLLKEYEVIGNSHQIDHSSLILSADPLIEYSDIESYDESNFTYKLSSAGQGKIKNLEHSVRGVAFAVTANDELVYTAYFWPSYSSTSCDWIVADPIPIEYSGLCTMKLGYASTVNISDKNLSLNDDRIIRIFERDGKLKD